MSIERVCGRFLNETGRIDYYIVKKDAGYAFKVEQERGVLSTAETEVITKSYTEAISLVKSFAEKGVTAVLINDICEDMLWRKIQYEQESIKNT